MTTPFGLAVQLLETGTDRVLVLAEVASARQPDRWFRSVDVVDVFNAFRVPMPKNISQALAQLERAGYVIRGAGQLRAVTPLGNERARELVAGLDAVSITSQQHRLPGAEFGHALHATLPPELAPIKWAHAIDRLLQRFPFESNVFCMTRFPDSRGGLPDPVVIAIEAAAHACLQHGLHLHLAGDRQIDDDLLSNVAGYMWACQYGLALFEDRQGDGLNRNVLLETGAMLMTGRRCALLRDETAGNLPTDLIGLIRKDVDVGSAAAVSLSVHQWIAEDLGLGRCPSCEA